MTLVVRGAAVEVVAVAVVVAAVAPHPSSASTEQSVTVQVPAHILAAVAAVATLQQSRYRSPVRVYAHRLASASPVLSHQKLPTVVQALGSHLYPALDVVVPVREDSDPDLTHPARLDQSPNLSSRQNQDLQRWARQRGRSPTLVEHAPGTSTQTGGVGTQHELVSPVEAALRVRVR